MDRAVEAFAQARAIIHIENPCHAPALTAFGESKQEGAVLSRICKKFTCGVIRAGASYVFNLMNTSATPLLLLMIGTIIILALGVHAVSASDPLYGSELELALTVLPSADR